MTINDHGRKIKEVWLQGEGNAFNECVKSGTHGDLEMSATYHGDRDEFWIVVKSDGVETRRINARYVTEFSWENSVIS